MGTFQNGPGSNALVPMGSRNSEERMSDNFDELENNYMNTAVDLEEQIDFFAQQLDACFISESSPTAQRAKIFKLLDQYYKYAKQRAERVDDDNEMDVDGDVSRPGHNGTGHTWAEEAQTWDLLRRLLPLKYRDKSVPSHSPEEQSVPRSRSQHLAAFLQSDPKAKEHKTVLEWLQSNAASSRPDIDTVVKDLQRSAERGDIVSHGWLHTKGAIKQHKRLVGASDPIFVSEKELGNSKLEIPERRVTQLDPDVRLRQAGRKLAPQDVFFERAVWLGCFELLRRGSSMVEIRDWCQERTESWRAATISALPLSVKDDEDVANFEPSALVLWRRMCAKLANDNSVEDPYERAVYGVLSGARSAVEQVAQCWDDFQFAKYNADLREKFDHYLQYQLGSNRFSSALLHSGGANNDSPNRNPATVLKALQDAVIRDGFDKFMYHQGQHLAAEANQQEESKLIPLLEDAPARKPEDKIQSMGDADGVRVLAHIQIIVSALDKLEGKDPNQLGHFKIRHETQENALAIYTSTLRLLRITEPIPLYASRFTGERVYTSLSRNLVHLDSPDLRTGALQYMQKLGLDIDKFITTGPQLFLNEADDVPGVCPAKGEFSILKDGAPTPRYGRLIKQNVFGDDIDAQDDEGYALDGNEELLVRSMEWMLLVPGLVVETCEYATRIYKYFLKHQKLAAARLLSHRVPLSEIFREKLGIEQPSQDDEVDPRWWDSIFDSDAGQMDVDNFADTGLTKEGLAAVARPLWEFECLINAMDCLATTAMVAEGHMSDASRDRDVASVMSGNAKDMKAFMAPILDGWLLTPVKEVDPDLELLRETYLPDVVIGYASTLQYAGTTSSRDFLLECMELASLVAEKDSDIATLLVKVGRMRELVESFTSCSKALAIWTSDIKKGPGQNSKKLKEVGWSRQLWAVKP